MKTRILLILVLVLVAATRSIGANYGFYVAGVPIDAQNYTDIIGAIQDENPNRITVLSGGSITFTPSTNTLRLKNVTITRNGSQNRGITNDGRANLKVVFEGTVKLDAQDASPILCRKDTYLSCENGGTVTLYTENSDGLTANGCTIWIENADMTITAVNKLGIMSDDNGDNVADNVSIKNSTVSVTAKNGAVSKLSKLTIDGVSTVTLNGSSTAVTVNNLSDLSLGEDMQISSPSWATFSSTKKAIVTSSSPNGYMGTIKFTTTAIAVNNTNFPNATFCTWVSNHADSNGDGYLTKAEREAVKAITVSGQSLDNLTGIAYFTKLETFKCYSSSVKSINLSENTALKTLECYDNSLLTSLSVSNNTNLTKLDCHNNDLTMLTVSNKSKLTTLDCSGNGLTSLTVSNNTALTTLDCSNNDLNSLSLSSNTALTTLDCSNNDLKSLSLSSNTALKTLNCGNNSLNSLIISGCSRLETLKCRNNSLSSLDFSGNKNLETVDCRNNGLITLNVSKSTLKTLNCSNNRLTSLDLSYKYDLTSLYCNNNQLFSLDVTECKALTTLDCYNNCLKGIDMTKFVNSLATVSTTATLRLNDPTSGNDQNDPTSSQITIAQNKGFNVMFYRSGWYSYADGFSIDDTNFPDANFQSYLRGQSYGSDGMITYKEILDITAIDVRNLGISKLNGIWHFDQLRKLYCQGNNLVNLSLSYDSKLEYLDCSNNQLSSLTLAMDELKTLDCSHNNLKDLFVSGCKNLKVLECNDNYNLANLNLDNNVELEYLDCSNNYIGRLRVLNHPKLTDLYCSNIENLTSLDLSNNPNLETLSCFKNKLEQLDLSHNPKLKFLNCHHNQLTSINVEGCSKLVTMLCYRNKLSAQAFNSILSNRIDTEGGCRIEVQYNYILDPDENEFNGSLVRLAHENNWYPWYYDSHSWYEYDESSFPTRIDSADNEEVADDAPRYNLQGQRVGKDYRGVVIVNGRKVRVK